MKILTWNLKVWPSIDGLPDEGEKADADSQAVTTADVQGADPIDRKWEKGKLVDFARVDKLIEIISGMADLPDVIYLQEVVSKRFVDYVVAKINGRKGDIIYKYIAHYNEPEVPQGMSIISKHEITETFRIDVQKYLVDHPRVTQDVGDLKGTLSLNTFIGAGKRPEFDLTVGGDQAWGKILNYAPNAGTFPTLRPVLAAKIIIDSKPVWCINVHMKSNLPAWNLLGLHKLPNPDPQSLSIAYAINKTIREITAYAVVGFTEYQSVAFPESKASFLVAGDFNTMGTKGTDKPEVSGENTLKILEGAGFKRAKVGGGYVSFNDFENEANGIDIDHVFWKGMADSLLANASEKSSSIINVRDQANLVKYSTVSTDSPDTYTAGNYYVVPKELSKKPETNLYLAKATNSFMSEESGLLKEGVTIYYNQKSYTILPQKAREDRKAVVLNPGTTQKILVELSGKCAIKETSTGKEGTIASLLGAGSHYVEIKAGSFEGGSQKKLGKPKFDDGNWEPVLRAWSSVKKSYFKGQSIVYQGAKYVCTVPHDTLNQEIGDPAYLKKYWTKVSNIDSSPISDHNGLLVEIA